MDRYAEVFRALGDETRLRILNLFVEAGSELCVCEVTDALEVPQYNVSRHLKVLKNAGLIRDKKEGRWVYFRLLSDSQFKEAIIKSVSYIPAHILAEDRAELKRRLKIRVMGKCLKGVQKRHLLNKAGGK